MNPLQLRRVVFDAGVVGSVVLSKLDDLLSEVDADGGDEVRAEGVVDVLNEAARLADAGVAQHQELDDVIEVERSHLVKLSVSLKKVFVTRRRRERLWKRIKTILKHLFCPERRSRKKKKGRKKERQVTKNRERGKERERKRGRLMARIVKEERERKKVC